MLGLVAHPDTVAAQDTLGGVPHNGPGGVVQGLLLLQGTEPDVPQTKAAGQLLKAALAALFTQGAVPAVGGEQQLQDHAAVLVELRGMGADAHTMLGRGGAGSHHAAPLVLHHAHPARAVDGEVGIIAEGGQLDSRLAHQSENIGFLVKFYPDPVNKHILRHLHPPQPRDMAWKLQFSMHAPHLIHLLWSMTWGFFTVPEMAPTGQLRLHLVQPLHSSGSIV